MGWFTCVSFNVCKFASNKSAVSFTSPLENFFSNFTSWEFLLSKRCTESRFHSKIECSALFFDHWWLRGYWYSLGEFLPFSVDISPPLAVIIFISKATMMPVASVVWPSYGSKSFLWWTPVVPFLIVVRELIPDLKSSVPFPQNLWDLGIFTPCANFKVTWVLLNKFHTFSLGTENVVILCINLIPSFTKMFLGSTSDVTSTSLFIFAIFKLNLIELIWFELKESLLIIALVVLALSLKKFWFLKNWVSNLWSLSSSEKECSKCKFH